MRLHRYFFHANEFFLNVFSLNSVTKIFVIKRTRTCHLLCKRPECHHSASKTHVRYRIFKLTPIHASVIIGFSEFNESSAPFRKNAKEQSSLQQLKLDLINFLLLVSVSVHLLNVRLLHIIIGISNSGTSDRWSLGLISWDNPSGIGTPILEKSWIHH